MTPMPRVSTARLSSVDMDCVPIKRGPNESSMVLVICSVAMIEAKGALTGNKGWTTEKRRGATISVSTEVRHVI